MTATSIATREADSLSTAEFSALRTATQDFVRQYMSRYDASHDYAHIQRVHALALRLAASHPSPLDLQLVSLSALLHDVGDHKYTSATTTTTPVQDFLLAASCPPALARAVQTITASVSYSKESQNPDSVAEVLARYPELAVVQDADRIDALGAVGVARCFVFGGVKSPERGLEGSVEHFGEKLLKLEALMKTAAGREIARERTRRIEVFWTWWKEENTLAEDEAL
ncbi:HD domain-containing protein [Sphaerosporella brunnea]|uniref:HD domain-containing protein n=1 Tax=Sphaerosporella brunnea TaxID=1250544 RepID=A0A5J5F5D5_9PEZI|nr:HD domain-containing protein [Sphaerosporella brunnea]